MNLLFEEMTFSQFLIEKSAFQKLQDNKIPLDPEERKLCMDRKCVWNFHHSGPTPAVWKSKDKKGKVTYITNTHRAYNTATTVKGAIKRYHDFIKGTA